MEGEEERGWRQRTIRRGAQRNDMGCPSRGSRKTVYLLLLFLFLRPQWEQGAHPSAIIVD
jgi:hypothetical protein